MIDDSMSMCSFYVQYEPQHKNNNIQSLEINKGGLLLGSGCDLLCVRMETASLVPHL